MCYFIFVLFLLQLFDHIADCIGKFVSEHNLVNHTLPLGFTFSFPCQQEGLAKARLSKWTKGFRCEGVVGEDICALLHEALQRKTVSRTFWDLIFYANSCMLQDISSSSVMLDVSCLLLSLRHA